MVVLMDFFGQMIFEQSIRSSTKMNEKTNIIRRTIIGVRKHYYFSFCQYWNKTKQIFSCSKLFFIVMQWSSVWRYRIPHEEEEEFHSLLSEYYTLRTQNSRQMPMFIFTAYLTLPFKLKKTKRKTNVWYSSSTWILKKKKYTSTRTILSDFS